MGFKTKFVDGVEHAQVAHTRVGTKTLQCGGANMSAWHVNNTQESVVVVTVHQ